MKLVRFICTPLIVALLLAIGWSQKRLPAEEQTATAVERLTETEAKQQARVLHEALHATLHVVHADYYREDERLAIPAVSLQKVFRELENRQKVKLKWLSIDLDAMNADNRPSSSFEKEAAKALASGKAEFAQSESDVFRYVGLVTLTSDCLKCHAPNRTSNKDRKAGLSITIPLKKSSQP
ncbi:c-type heme family protein [Anatilimnocola floriformis]|uniref:c-type heme family protein n=1 Tax=Anatilimnocola floriformis TaxID=2948575 RepID=UPI0020C4914E|nr:DUF3365 domain-containing protein [Anatilimnocola floriformis]